jgi:hypothetical protein
MQPPPILECQILSANGQNIINTPENIKAFMTMTGLVSGLSKYLR